MTTRVTDILRAADTHANRPVASAVPAGALYACSTHSLVYRSDGTNWSTWATAMPLGSSTGQVPVWDNATSTWSVATPSSSGLRDYASASRTSGVLTCNQTAITELVATSLDLTVDASAGELVGLGISGLANSGNQSIGLAFYSMVSGSRVNAVGYGLTASLSGAAGVPSWYVSSSITGPVSLSGEIPYTVQAGDLVSGQVTFRLHYAKSTTTARTINADTTFPLRVWAKNYGPV